MKNKSIMNILLYKGMENSTSAMILNYLVILNMLVYLINNGKRKEEYYIIVTALLFLGQITLCKIVGCVGVSLVWCALYGIILSEMQDRHRTFLNWKKMSKLEKRIVISNTLLLLIYFITLPKISTYAHIGAIGIGIAVEKAMSVIGT